MFGWLKRKVQIVALDSCRVDLQRFVDGLSGMTDSEIGAALAYATVVRLQLEKSGVLPRDALLGRMGDVEIAAIPLKLGRIIRELQMAGKVPEAASVMVWLHSLRAILYPELRNLGRQMWRELWRGSAIAVTESVPALEATMGDAVPADTTLELHFVPTPLSRFSEHTSS